MGKTAILGAILILVGIAGLAMGSFNYTETKPVPKASPLMVNSKEEHHISIPTIGSIVILLADVALVITERRSCYCRV